MNSFGSILGDDVGTFVWPFLVRTILIIWLSVLMRWILLLLIRSIWWIKLFLVFVKLLELVRADRLFVQHPRRESSPLIAQYYQLVNDWTLRAVWSGRHGWLKVLLRPDSTPKWEAQHVPDERAYQVTIGRASLGSQCTILSRTDQRAIS